MNEDNFKDRLSTYMELVKQLAKHYSEIEGRDIPEQDIKIALFEQLSEKEDLVALFDLPMVQLTFEGALQILDGYNFTLLSIVIALDASNFPDGIIPDTFASVRVGGRQWRIHLSDADKWPSDPHAHLLGTKIKLDLSNGACYKGRIPIRALTYNQLMAVRKAFEHLPAFQGKLPDLSV